MGCLTASRIVGTQRKTKSALLREVFFQIDSVLNSTVSKNSGHFKSLINPLNSNLAIEKIKSAKMLYAHFTHDFVFNLS